MFLLKQGDKIVYTVKNKAEIDNIRDLIFDSIEQVDEEYVLSDLTGQYVTAQELEQAERKRLNMLSLTKREVFLALYKDKGITPEELRAQITEPEAQIEFDYANEYYRGNPLIDKIGIMLGYSIEDLDYLFENKELPIKEDTGT